MTDPHAGISNSDEVGDIREIWDRIVQVQMHFNEIGIKIRNFLVTLVLAIFAGAGFILNNDISFSFAGFSISAAFFVFLFGALGVFLLYFMDRYWYHRLLKGSVDAAIPISKKLGHLPGINLGEKISKNSELLLINHKWLYPFIWCRIVTVLARDSKNKPVAVRSDGKLQLFYKTNIFLFLVLASISAIGTLTYNNSNLFELIGVLGSWMRSLCS
ncbi:membrane hypothetical protein [Oceanicaulis sp. 350]|nr:membrane hypothetical protein [Oceanicaulis sp. 350]